MSSTSTVSNGVMSHPEMCRGRPVDRLPSGMIRVAQGQSMTRYFRFGRRETAVRLYHSLTLRTLYGVLVAAVFGCAPGTSDDAPRVQVAAVQPVPERSS